MLLLLLGTIRTATQEFVCILLARNPLFSRDHPPSVKNIVVYLEKKGKIAVEHCESTFSKHVVPRMENCDPFWRAGTLQAKA